MPNLKSILSVKLKESGVAYFENAISFAFLSCFVFVCLFLLSFNWMDLAICWDIAVLGSI